MEMTAASNVLGNIEVCSLPDGYVPLDVVMLVKCLSAEGDPVWAIRYSPGVNAMELLGATRIMAHKTEKDHFDNQWIDQGNDEESDGD